MYAKKAGISIGQDQQKDDLGTQPVQFLVIAGFGCLCGWELTVMFSPVLPLLGFAPLGQAVPLYLIAQLASFVTAIAVWRYADRILRAFKGLAVGSFLPYVAVIAAAVLPFVGFTWGLAVLAWIALGIGQALLVIFWSALLSLLPPGRTASATTWGSMFGTAIFIIVASIPDTGANLFGAAFVLGVAIAAALFLLRSIPARKLDGAARYEHDPLFSKPSVFNAVLHSSVYGFILVALFSFGLVPALIGAASGIVGAALALMWAHIDQRCGLDSSVMLNATLPVIVAGLLLMPFFGEAGQIACCCAINAAHAFYRTSSIASLTTANAEFSLHPVRQSAFGRIPTLFGLLAGVLFGFVVIVMLDVSGRLFDLIMACIAIAITCAVALYSLLGSHGARVRAHMLIEGSLAPDNAIPSSAEPSALEEVVRLYRLTPREAEVFSLLARGRNAEYIQQKLTLAPGTVKTHIYHIYQKTGVNSQQRLMDLVDHIGD